MPYMYILILLFALDEDINAAADCFKVNSSLISDIQATSMKLVLSPIDNLAENSICYGMRGRSSTGMLIVFDNKTDTTKEVYSKQLLRTDLDNTVEYQFTNFSNVSDFATLTEIQNIMYKVWFGTTQSISTTAALNEIMLIQRNATTCWSNIKLEYNLLPEDVYISLSLVPTSCGVVSSVEIFLDYKISFNSQWISIPLPQTNTSSDNTWVRYSHENWTSYRISVQSLKNEAIQANFSKFMSDFVEMRSPNIRLRLQYVDRSLNANIIGAVNELFHKNSILSKPEVRFLATIGEEEIVSVYQNQKIFNQLVVLYPEIKEKAAFFETAIYIQNEDYNFSLVMKNSRAFTYESLPKLGGIDVFKFSESGFVLPSSFFETHSLTTMTFYLEILDADKKVIAGQTIQGKVLYNCISVPRVQIQQDRIRLQVEFFSTKQCHDNIQGLAQLSLILQTSNGDSLDYQLTSYYIGLQNVDLKFNNETGVFDILEVYFTEQNAVGDISIVSSNGQNFKENLQQFIDNALLPTSDQQLMVLIANQFGSSLGKMVVGIRYGQNFSIFIAVSVIVTLCFAIGILIIIFREIAQQKDMLDV